MSKTIYIKNIGLEDLLSDAWWPICIYYIAHSRHSLSNHRHKRFSIVLNTSYFYITTAIWFLLIQLYHRHDAEIICTQFGNITTNKLYTRVPATHVPCKRLVPAVPNVVPSPPPNVVPNVEPVPRPVPKVVPSPVPRPVVVPNPVPNPVVPVPNVDVPVPNPVLAPNRPVRQWRA